MPIQKTGNKIYDCSGFAQSDMKNMRGKDAADGWREP